MFSSISLIVFIITLSIHHCYQSYYKILLTLTLTLYETHLRFLLIIRYHLIQENNWTTSSCRAGGTFLVIHELKNKQTRKQTNKRPWQNCEGKAEHKIVNNLFLIIAHRSLDLYGLDVNLWDINDYQLLYIERGKLAMKVGTECKKIYIYFERRKLTGPKHDMPSESSLKITTSQELLSRAHTFTSS